MCVLQIITNVCFANDILLFSRGDEGSVGTMMQKFDQFSCATGLKANPAKCKIYFGGTDVQTQKNIGIMINYRIGTLPFKYLGVPLSTRKLTINQCQPLIDRMLKKIQHWSANFLSYVGRQQLVNNTLMTIAGYWMQDFPLSKAIVHRIEAICKNFLWSGKAVGRKALVSWEKVYKQKNAGVLNLNCLVDWNKATILKMLWNLHMKSDKLWIRWIGAYYLKGVSIMHWEAKATSSWMLKSIIKTRMLIQDNKYRINSVQHNYFSTSAMYKDI